MKLYALILCLVVPAFNLSLEAPGVYLETRLNQEQGPNIRSLMGSLVHLLSRDPGYFTSYSIGPALQNEEENSELNSQQQLLEEQFNEEDEPLSEELNKRPKNSKSERHQFENILSALQETVENIERPALLPEDWTSMKHESSEKLENELEPEIPLDLFYKPGYLNAEHKNRMVVTEQSKGEQQLLTKSRLSPGYLKTPKMSRRKRNPRCLRSCLKRGYLHPAQCHMLC